MLTNTVMAGRLGPGPLAGVAVGGSYYQMFWLFGLGILMSISPIVAHAYGARPRRGGGPALPPGPVAVADARRAAGRRARCASSRVLVWFGTDPRAIPHASGYVHAMCFGMPAMLVFLAHRYTSEGIGWTRPVMYTAAVGLSINIAGNWVFTLGQPRHSVAGRDRLRHRDGARVLVDARHDACLPAPPRDLSRASACSTASSMPDRRRSREILALGLPIAGSVVSEGALFAVAALLMSTLGTVTSRLTRSRSATPR